MPRDGEIVEVYANPYLHLDASGEPQCVVPKGPNDGRGWYGATFSAETGKFTVSGEVIRCCFSRYIKERIWRGELIAGTEKLAGELGINFIEPKKLLEGFRVQAAEIYDAQHGAGAFARAEADRAAAKKATEEAAAKAEADRAAAKKATEEAAAKAEAEAKKTADQPAKTSRKS